ncbi:hypothetical protein TRVL_09491 [Trypanosoma vivax]|uniref:Uncharacterized protein n=1 Tax=Trypanosoma vivax (strain Y486) TaxID=1055687 RepID=F9WQ11_TRYVY|nr:hypothetical protein TRVL_09491 [Trypanosoma vivax]CCD19638.1 hypothetical protein, conserved [Trypanosoma vivax Y486]|eukprot:CCD19638.1 hypothetical protein, conserved [Trypanosoma vivax Y486]
MQNRVGLRDMACCAAWEVLQKLSFEAALAASVKVSRDALLKTQQLHGDVFFVGIATMDLNRNECISVLRSLAGLEHLIIAAVERTLAGYAEFALRNDMQGPSLESCWLHVSLSNLHSLAVCFSRRPPMPSLVMAALLQLTAVAAHHSPSEALGTEGCNVLVSLLQLLVYLPRSSGMRSTPSILRVARVTIRNIMRTIGPALSSMSGCCTQNGWDATAAAPHKSTVMNREIIPWLERQLIPLNVLTSTGAQAELREDRGLALSLLEYVPCDLPHSVEVGNYFQLLHLAEAVDTLLLVESGGIEGQEREQALSFLEKMRCFLQQQQSAIASLPALALSHAGAQNAQAEQKSPRLVYALDGSRAGSNAACWRGTLPRCSSAGRQWTAHTDAACHSLTCEPDNLNESSEAAWDESPEVEAG